MEVERLKREYDVEVEFAPFLLDPSTPPEGKPRRQMSQPGSPPSAMEARGQNLGIHFSRGRTHTSNSHLALEGAEFAREHALGWEYHKAMLKAYFDDLVDIGKVDTVVSVAATIGLDSEGMRDALEKRAYRELVDEGIAWSRSIGVTAIPTFVFDERFGMVGAQEFEAFQEMMAKMGARPRGQKR